eukprot:403360205
MGNNCCSNEARKIENEQRKDIDQYFEKGSDDLSTPPPHGYFQGLGMIHSQSSSNSLMSMESRQFTLNKLMRKERGNRQRHKLRIFHDQNNIQGSSGGVGNTVNKNAIAGVSATGNMFVGPSSPSKSRTPQRVREPSPDAQVRRLNLLKQKQEQQRNTKEMKKNFEQNIYGKNIQSLIEKTLSELTQEIKNNLACQKVQRYDFAEIRRFLASSSWNPQIACKKIIQDIEWRNSIMPIATQEIAQILKTQHIVFSGSDREMCPCIYIRPNHRDSQSFFRTSGLALNQYRVYLVYIIEQLMPKLVTNHGFANKLSIVYDLENSDFRLDILEMIEDLVQNHYPFRLNRIFIVRISLQNITLKVKQKFQQKFYKRHSVLFDENYLLNLGKFFDPQELLKEYGGQIVAYKQKTNNSGDTGGGGEMSDGGKLGGLNVIDHYYVEQYMLEEYRLLYPIRSITQMPTASQYQLI